MIYFFLALATAHCRPISSAFPLGRIEAWNGSIVLLQAPGAVENPAERPLERVKKEVT